MASPAIQIFKQAFTDIPAGAEIVPRVHYYRQTLSAAALPESFEAFAAAPTNLLDWSLDQNKKVPDPFAVVGMGIYFEGDTVDARTFANNSFVRLKVVNKDYPYFPAFLLPAGGGIVSAVTGETAATTLTDYANLGVQDHRAIWTWPGDPIPIDIEQSFFMGRASRAGQTIVTASAVWYLMFGVEARPIQ